MGKAWIDQYKIYWQEDIQLQLTISDQFKEGIAHMI